MALHFDGHELFGQVEIQYDFYLNHSINKENFSKTLLLTKLLKFIFLQNSTPFPNTNYELNISFKFKFYLTENVCSKLIQILSY